MHQTFHDYAIQHAQELTDLTCAITLIPAPSRHEAARAAFCADWLRTAGAQGIEIDGSNNMIWRAFPGKSGKWIIFSAHLDTVFDLDVPLAIRQEGDRLYCPGIGDDSANLAVMLLGARWLLENPPKDNEYGFLFVATAAEEIGSVGMRAFLERFGTENIHRCYSFDACNTRLYNGTVNYYNYLVTVKTPGGHALGRFGMPNAIEELSKVLVETTANCRAYIAENKLKRTTVNVGTVCGGEKHNIIAPEAQMLIELRSDRMERCQVLIDYLMAAVEHYRGEQVEITAECVSNTAHWSTVDETVMDELAREHLEMMRPLGWNPRVSSACTDCRFPMSRGIPSLCLGLCYTIGPHSRDEYLVPDSLPTGLELLLMIFESVL